jgi:pilus assembly protein CpaF
LEEELAAELHGIGPLEGLVRDHTVSDILVNGPYDVWVDRHGRLERTDVRFDDEAHLLRLLARLTAAHGRHIEEATPYVDVRLADGSRLHAMIPPLTAGGPVMAIRRARTTPLRLEHLCAAGTLSPDMGAFLCAAVEAGLNILISGGASTGKTTLLNILAQAIPHTQRVVTIEETAELRIVHPHVVSLETRLPNIEGRGEVTMRTLVRNALRMRADRIIVGEVRGAEVFEMLQAMNVGHSGSLTTVHANSADDALRRLEMLALTGSVELPSRVIRELLGSAFHVAVHMTRLAGGARRVVSIGEIARENGSVASKEIFRLEHGTVADGIHEATGVRPAFIERLQSVRVDIERLLASPGAAGRAGAL